MHGIGVADITKLKSAGICTVRVSTSSLFKKNRVYKQSVGCSNDDKEESIENQGFIRDQS